MQTPQTANPPQGMPDVVGAKPENPVLASFRPFIPDNTTLPNTGGVPLPGLPILGLVVLGVAASILRATILRDP